jgi:hypothetical protein
MTASHQRQGSSASIHRTSKMHEAALSLLIYLVLA